MINILTTGILFGIIYLIYILTHKEIKLDDAAIGVDNPYYDNKINLTKYEQDLDDVFDYSKIRTVKLNENDDDFHQIEEEIDRK